MARKMSEEQKIKARERTAAYIQATGGAAQKAYRQRVKQVMLTLNPDKDGDILALFSDGEPRGAQLKEMLRELIQLRARCFYPPKNGG